MWSLAGLSVMPVDKLGWERLLLVLRQVTHSSAAAFLESSPNLSPAFCPAHCCSRRISKAFPSHSAAGAPSYCPPQEGSAAACVSSVHSRPSFAEGSFPAETLSIRMQQSAPLHPSGSLHPFERVEIMSTKCRSKVAVWMGEREGEPGAEGQQEGQK